MGQTVTLDQVVILAKQLSESDKLRLIEELKQSESALEQPTKKPLRSLHGLWKGIEITDQDIADARREMWGNFPRDDF